MTITTITRHKVFLQTNMNSKRYIVYKMVYSLQNGKISLQNGIQFTPKNSKRYIVHTNEFKAVYSLHQK